MPNLVVHWEIMGGDEHTLQDFYAQLFDWNVDANNPMNYGLVSGEANGRGIGGGIGPDPSGQSRVTVYIEVDDLDAYLKKAESLGGKTIMPPTEIPNMVTFAMFSDPAGNVTGMIKRMS